jgi:hypothetical protein
MELTYKDKAVIRAVAERDNTAARIFLTGEVREDYIGSKAALMLYAINDMLDEPLFIQTRWGTAHMERFDPEVVWRCFHPDLLMELQCAEEERLALDPVRLDIFDFYQSFAASKKGMFPVPYEEPIWDLNKEEVFYQVLYLGSILLYGKGGYARVPVAQHFAGREAEQFMRNIRYEKIGDVPKGSYNEELKFMMRLYDKFIV